MTAKGYDGGGARRGAGRGRPRALLLMAILLAGAVFGSSAPGAAVPGTAAGTVDFNRDVRPILAERCFSCHGPDAKARQAGLRLDEPGGAYGLLASGRRAVVPGDAGASELLRRVAASDSRRMPPAGVGKSLTAGQVAALRRWIQQGAGYARHWAFAPPERPALPAVKNAAWPITPIDRFILARMEERGLRPSPAADRATLIRRVTLDLTGLPPAPAEVQAFLADTRPGAYERVVDRLLQSPHYGERWARNWLDLARYADSNGYSIDAPRSMWKYRDWVIDALNRDVPFDRFAIEQIAGDLLPSATREQKIATGLHRNTPINQEGGIDLEQFRVESVVDRVNATATVFLGLTLGCAQCHDHKYDPFAQREYYQLLAFFNNADEPELEIAEPEEIARRDTLRAQVNALKGEQAQYLKSFLPELAEWEKNLSEEARLRLGAPAQAALAVPAAKRSENQQLALLQAFKAEDGTYLQRQARITELEKQLPRFVTTLVMRERPEPRATHVHIQGDFTRKGERVPPGVPAVLHPLTAGVTAPSRLDLARWIVDARNPLTARVTVNRAWQQLFGRGLVETENDFGTQGARPTHPELLDWLAVAFMTTDDRRPTTDLRRPTSDESNRMYRMIRMGSGPDKDGFFPSFHPAYPVHPVRFVGGRSAVVGGRSSDAYSCGWSMKELHRLIVTSATYRQASRFRPELERIDPSNRLLARQGRLRLDAEVVRDVALAASGLLSRKVGGPSVYPPQPEGVFALTQVKRPWVVSAGDDRYRRGMYTFFFRSAPHPALMVFDAPDAVSACTRRNRSNTPLQALTLLNDEGFFEFSRALAARVLQEAPPADPARMRHLVRLCLAREPQALETRRLLDLLAQQRAGLAAVPQDTRALVGPEADTELAAWTLVARVVLNLDEFITRE